MAAQSTGPIWTPSQARINGSNIARYLQFYAMNTALNLPIISNYINGVSITRLFSGAR